MCCLGAARALELEARRCFGAGPGVQGSKEELDLVGLTPATLALNFLFVVALITYLRRL